jgi:asparagine synthase (glutamine-hydrolysing)
MCRITGIIDFNKNAMYPLDAVISKMRDTMHTGGPDDAGNFIEQNEHAMIAFGHRRLSIIDLSDCGHQPMHSADKNEVICFNGEIYNYKEIKTELQHLGISFQFDNDTEVILQAYQKWGIDCVKKFIGMFAFLLYDKKKNVVYAVRDRAGVKPLYYYFHQNLILFGSELKSFHSHPGFEKKINSKSLALFLQFSCIPAPYSIFENAFKIMPGHYLSINLSNQSVEDISWWSAMDAYQKPLLKNIDKQEIIIETERLLTSACNYRMVADVPVGVFLSGGYDSTLVTALLQKESNNKIKTFSIGFQEKGFDEAIYAKQVAEHLGTEHTEYYCTQQDALEIIPLLPEIYDEPFGDSSAIPTTLVSKIARKSVKVALSADGGDEVFGGYEKYSIIINLKNKLNLLPNRFAKTTGRFLSIINPDFLSSSSFDTNLARQTGKFSRILQSESMAEMAFWFGNPYSSSQIEKLAGNNSEIEVTNFFHLKNKFVANDDINSMLAIDYITYLPDDILTKVDRATMSVGLEGREPLLDQRLLEWAAQIPGDVKIENGIKKNILKEIVHKYVPKGIMDRPKMGFGVPITQWFKNDLKDYFETYISEKNLGKHNLLNAKMVLDKKNAYYKGNNKMATELWNILMFQMWYERWMG